MSICINEKGTEAFSDEKISDELLKKIAKIKEELSNDILILGHHYQQDEIIKFADKTGDSFELARFAAECKDKKYIIFCGVHFMAETADILTSDDQIVILPDLAAGCSMADMANLDDVEKVYNKLTMLSEKKIIPITYMNSTADIKAFVGKMGGVVCTSSNAEAVLKWAFSQGEQILFIPDEHLGRNTAFKMDVLLEQIMVVERLDTVQNIEKEILKKIKVFLWKGHCSVHMNFRPEHVELMKKKFSDVNVIVHPECVFEVVQKSDYVGSTSKIIKIIEKSSDGTRWAIGTEHHLVNRLAKQYKNKIITTLAPFTCQCSTMYRISPESLYSVLENLKNGKVINRIEVDEETKRFARISLQKMLDIN